MKKKIIGMATGMSICLCGCKNIAMSTSLTDHILLNGEKTRLTLKECSLVFLDFQTRYNLYYENLGESDFWNEEIKESTFSDYLRDTRIKEELCTLILLNDMAYESKVALTDEEKQACRLAAADYYSTLSVLEKEYVQAEESHVISLYEKYHTAQKMIDLVCEDINEEISDNNKRVMILQIIASDSREDIEEAKKRVDSGEDFETVAKQLSALSQIEYQVSRGVLNPILEEKAIYMSDRQISDIIETEENYYIICCVDDFDKELSAANESKVLESIRYAVWSQEFTEYASEHTVSVSEEIWKNIQFYKTASFTSDDLYETYDRYIK